MRVKRWWQARKRRKQINLGAKILPYGHNPDELPYNILTPGQPMNLLFCPKCRSCRVASGQEAKTGGSSTGMVLAMIGPIHLSKTIKVDLICLECGQMWKERKS